MWGVEFAAPDGHRAAAAPAAAVVSAAMRRGLLVYPAGGALPGRVADQILVGPPLTIGESEMADLGRLLRAAVDDALA
jgi:adenosylmethionine-8-amino-7-oxononanoate aminotransferase